jgi:hypothetical protein
VPMLSTTSSFLPFSPAVSSVHHPTIVFGCHNCQAKDAWSSQLQGELSVLRSENAQLQMKIQIQSLQSAEQKKRNLHLQAENSQLRANLQALSIKGATTETLLQQQQLELAGDIRRREHIASIIRARNAQDLTGNIYKKIGGKSHRLSMRSQILRGSNKTPSPSSSPSAMTPPASESRSNPCRLRSRNSRPTSLYCSLFNNKLRSLQEKTTSYGIRFEPFISPPPRYTFQRNRPSPSHIPSLPPPPPLPLLSHQPPS